MLKSQAVSHLMTSDETDKSTHQIVGQRQVAGPGIQIADLYEVPVTQKVHHVVVPLDIGFQDLTGARILNVRSHRVLDG